MNRNLKTSVHRYIAVNDAIRAAFKCGQKDPTAIGSSRVASLFNAAKHGRAAYDLRSSGQAVTDPKLIESYFSDVPKPFFLGELSANKLSALIEGYGPDIMRANIISANLLEADLCPLVTGGACILETWATRLLDKPILKNNPGLRREVLHFILQKAPYYSHITGTMIAGSRAGYSLMYDETFPWFLAVHDLGKEPALTHSEWNVGIAEELCREFYDEIYAATQRRSRIVSDNGLQVLRLPFADLQLEEENHLKSWFMEYSTNLPPEFKTFLPANYDGDSFLGAHVRYTYVGPQILQLVKKRMAARGVDLSKFDFHVRTKQDDHLTEGKRVNRILLRGIQGEDKGFLSKYSNVCDLAIYVWHMQNWHRTPNGFIGFTDLSFKGNVVHDTINLATGDNGNPKNEEDLWDLLSSPLRLHKSNVDQHFEYLNRYIEPVYIHEEIASQIIGLEKTIQKLKIKVETIALHAKEREIIRDILKEFIPEKGTELKTGIAVHLSSIEEVFANQNVVEELKHRLRNLGKRYGKRNEVATASCAFEFFKRLDSELTVEIAGVIARVSLPMEKKYYDCLRALVKELNKEIAEYSYKANTEKATLAQLQKEDEQIIKHVRGISVHEIDLSVTKPTLFPLKDNMVFCHAIQLSFDSDISDFIVEAQEIEDSNLPLEQKRRHLAQAMEQVLPIVKTYIQMMMGIANHARPPHAYKKTYQPV
ncbi:MAG: transforming acidic coiled-coil-containing protein [Nitrospira sp.]|nr:transforming acidic coiled-coil-containing protein [Nitrospira sp.]